MDEELNMDANAWIARADAIEDRKIQAECYKKAIEIFPQFEDALINLGATYYNTGRYEEAHKTLLRCSQNKQNPRLQQYLKAVEEKLDKKEHK